MQRLKLLLIWVSTISTKIVIGLPTLEYSLISILLSFLTLSSKLANSPNLMLLTFLIIFVENENQIIIYKRIESHYATLLTNPECVDLVKLIVMGTAGTGNLI